VAEAVENKYKMSKAHLRREDKYSSKVKHYGKSKSKDKDKRRLSKGGHKKDKARAIVAGASDVDTSSSDAHSSSSSEDEDAGRRKGKKNARRNLRGLTCVALGAFVAWPIAQAARRVRKKTPTPTQRMR
jgi:hypothetical protein